jgi:hypothetical protein
MSSSPQSRSVKGKHYICIGVGVVILLIVLCYLSLYSTDKDCGCYAETVKVIHQECPQVDQLQPEVVQLQPEVVQPEVVQLQPEVVQPEVQVQVKEGYISPSLRSMSQRSKEMLYRPNQGITYANQQHQQERFVPFQGHSMQSQMQRMKASPVSKSITSMSLFKPESPFINYS